MSSASQVGKRGLDLVAALLALAALLPVLPLIALVIVAESRGPVFVRRPAVGVQRRRPRTDGRPGTDPRRVHDVGGELLRLPEFRLTTVPRPGAPARLTRSGRWLARTHLAHWPRFLSVLSGDLSLVGPRPLSPRCVAELLLRVPGWDRQLVGVKPGLLGPGLAHGRSDAHWVGALRDRVLFELDYGTRLARARRVRDVLALDLAVARACCARAWRSRVPLGHEVIRFDAPARLRHVPVDPRALLVPKAPWDAMHADGMAGAPTRGPSVELHPHGERLTAFWYPPRQRALRVPADGRAEPDLLQTADEPFEARWLVGEERPDCQLLVVHALRSERVPEPRADELHLDLPGGLHEIARVCEQLLPLWDALGGRRGEAALGSRVTRLLLAGFARVAAGRADGRIALDIHVGADRLVLQLTAQPPLPAPGDPADIPLPRMVLAPSLGALPATLALPAAPAAQQPAAPARQASRPQLRRR